MHPFCHLVVQSVRVDSPPLEIDGLPLSKSLFAKRLKLDITQQTLSARLNVSLRTYQDWERGLTFPARKHWALLRSL
jgi:DNA-binding transcriptional regulator YiaG